ncbi:hypothetical protein JX265_007512 [Neoarthrinium moseri]|uniref:DUF1770-domain-containing protein n=1 Tax=Neoarthrinium moseri TaxID=1658444 RepID=A0A9P9WJK2_9PEZI|nr:uncharacterized protein JN550_000074 [Neoarthrinium moseri]KAI1854619.1 hypothetical protein JX266_000737 [Neoarthrinium moseri]KAI1866936.1 hypothetical protein JX265_007512 [Neoarthrinium moseri]KAI1877892.1 hypothetical protein JN550_000074 [Neoarthrinium moseri]
MSIPTQIAETIQTAHIKRDPSPHHDANPSTSASAKEPVRASTAAEYQRGRRQHHGPDDDHEHDDDVAAISDDEDDEIPISVLRPHRRRTSFPPMPDLRFEQSYLHSIQDAEGWGRVVWITVRDQVMMPLAQGVLYNLAICGWQFWNRNAQYSGGSAGARLRRWWYSVNNWPIPPKKAKAA